MARHEQNISARSQMREESALLDHVTDAPPDNVDLVSAKLRPIELDLASIRLEQADDQTEQR